MPTVESFLTLEGSLQRRVKAAFDAEIQPAADKLSELVREQEFSTAEREVGREILLAPVARAVEKGLDVHFLQSYLLGAGLFAGQVRDSRAFQSGDIPDEVFVAAEQYKSVIMSSETALQRRARIVISQLEAAVAEDEAGEVTLAAQAVRKVADAALARQMNAAVMGTGRGLMDAGANLTTSRLVSFGFLDEAKNAGVETFQITEVLDDRTCPFCSSIHGMTFSVGPAHDRVLTQLQMSGDDLRAAAPFPNQSKSGLRDIAKMSNSDMQKRGFDTPPFHPSCRGILVPIGTVPRREVRGFGRFLGGEGEPALAPTTTNVAATLPASLRSVSSRISSGVKGPKAKQAIDDLDALYVQAAEADVVLRETVTEIASDVGGTAVFPPGLKGRARVIEKANAKYGGDFAAITDFSRATIEFDNLDELYSALGKLEARNIKIVRINDRFAKPTPEGYSDIILGVEMPNGHVAELQLHTRKMRAAKEANHEAYEQQRSIHALAKAEERGFTKREQDLLNQLAAQQQASYGAAFTEALGAL